MIQHLFRLLISVRAKLFFGFLSMAFVIAVLGSIGVLSVMRAGQVVEATYDRPLMAISYARASGLRFMEMARDIEYGDLDPQDAPDVHATFLEDLAVARNRNLSERALPFFESVETASTDYVSQIALGTGRRDTLHALAKTVSSDLDVIVELQTGEAFRMREAATAQIGRLKRNVAISVGCALLMTGILTAWLILTIVHPLDQAATAARRISAGDFTADIPQGRRDETGALLAAMTKMRNTIRARMAQETAARDLAQSRLAESLDNSKDAVVLTNPGGRIILANARLPSLFPELHNQRLLDVLIDDVFDYQGRPLFGQYQWTGDSQIASSDGRWVRINASSTREGGRLLIWTDITQDMRSRAVLQNTMEQALAADKSKTDFLASMSHELRTPLNAVIGFADILAREQLGPCSVPDYTQMAGHIHESGRMLLGIVENVLEIASGDVSVAAGQVRAVDAADALVRALMDVSVGARRKGVTLRHAGPRNGLHSPSEGDQLDQILRNLLSNAVKFTPTGGQVEASITMDEAGRVDISIRDTGIGIPADRIDDMRQPFVQMETGSMRTHDGVGLGLTIVDRLVSRLGGRFILTSDFGSGTTARITLPRCEAPSEPVTDASLPSDLSQAA